MRISMIGLGYVGAVTGSALAEIGHEVVGVDLDESKVALLRSGQSPIPEPGLAELIRNQVDGGRLSATTSLEEAVSQAQLVIISVGTPTDAATGDPDLSAVRRVATSLAETLAARTSPLLVAVSSTVPPGTTEGLIRPILESKSASPEDFRLCFLPEFLREGTAIDDFRNPTRFVIGARSQDEAEPFRELRGDIPKRHHLVDTAVAEMQKSAENCWHATKVTFANEISRVAEAQGIDPHLVMELLLADDKQNVSAAYLRPGFAYGGSCLPKDLRSVVRLADKTTVSIPMLRGIAESNRQHIDSAVARVASFGKPRIGILGLAFKAGTDDLRESPAIELAEALIGRGFDVVIHDYDVQRHATFGANKNVWNQHEHLHGKLVDSVATVLDRVDVVVIAQFNSRYVEAVASRGESVELVDLTGLTARVGSTSLVAG